MRNPKSGNPSQCIRLGGPLGFSPPAHMAPPVPEVDGCCKVAPLVALLAGQPSLLASVDAAVRVVQNTDKAAAFACGFARVLEKLVLGTATVQEAVSAAQQDLTNPDRTFRTALDDEVAMALGRAIGEFADLSHAQVGLKLKPEAATFPFAGIS